MYRKILYFTMFICGGVFSSVLYAKPVTLEYTAVIEYLDDPGFALEGKIVTGGSISGSFTYDSEMPDEDPGPDSARYFMASPSPVEFGFFPDLSPFSFIKSSDADINIQIFDNPSDEMVYAGSCCRVGSLSNGVVIEHMFMDLRTSNGNALNYASLTGIQDLNLFTDKMLFIDGRSADGSMLHLASRIVSIGQKFATCPKPAVQDRQKYTAVVRDIYGADSSLSAYFKPGSRFSGEMRFNPYMSDIDSTPEHAFYDSQPGDLRTGVKLVFGSGTYTNDTNSYDLDVHVFDYPQNSGLDVFDIVSFNNHIVLPNGIVISEVITSLRDPSAMTLSSTSLQDGINAPLSAWRDREVMISGSTPDGGYFHVLADIVSLDMENIPPVTSPVTVVPASGLTVMGQNFDVGVIIDAGLPPVMDVLLKLMDSNGIYATVPCMAGQIGQDGRMTAICPAVSWKIHPGNNQFTVEVRFGDGTIEQQNGSWDAVGY